MAPTRYPTLYFITGNVYKAAEYQSMLNLTDLKHAEREVLEIQTSLLDVLVKRKVEEVRSSLPGLPIFVEHVGLEIRAWKGLPGGLTSAFMDTVGNDGICDMMHKWPGDADRQATAVAVIGYAAPEGHVEIFRGESRGIITAEPRGTHGFGWDPIFKPHGHDQTYAEMMPEEKNKISMRRIVAGKFYLSVIKENFELLDGGDDESELEQKDQIDTVQLHQSIRQGFDLNEIRNLCFMLKIEYEDVPGNTRMDKARELIKYMNRRGRLEELYELCRSLRPDLDWD